MTRSVPEWIGATDDARVPPRVRLRIFLREGGVCHLSGRKIAPAEPWDLDHVVALINGGQHREFNLKPALRDKHRVKSAADVAEAARVASRAKSHTGALAKPSRIKSAGFRPAPPQARATSPLIKQLPPRRITP